MAGVYPIIKRSGGDPTTTHQQMTNTLPALANHVNHFLISADGQELIRFCNAGDHQMMMTRFAIEAGEWQPQGGGFDWTGRVRERYQSYTAKGYRKIA